MSSSFMESSIEDLRTRSELESQRSNDGKEVSDSVCDHLCTHLTDQTLELRDVIHGSFRPERGRFCVKRHVIAQQRVVLKLTAMLQEVRGFNDIPP